MAYVSVNVDYIAVIREARKTDEPDPVTAATIVELAGAHGVTAHLREDRRHIVDRDIRLLRQVVRLPFNLEMAATDEMLGIAVEVLPDLATLVPERRLEVTTEGGLDVAGNRGKIADAISRLNDHGIMTSLFVDPDERQIEASRSVGAHCVELHTGEYANARTEQDREHHCDTLRRAACFAQEHALEVHAGHGLTYRNVTPVAAIHQIAGLYIGHSIMARAIFVGLERAIQEMIHLTQYNQRG